MSLIEIRQLDVTYRVGYKTVFVLRGINLDVNCGDYVCIIGNNGAGKSTLIKSVLGLVPLARGSIKIGCPRDCISYLPQNIGIPFDFPATVEEVVLSGTQRARCGRKFRLPFYSKEDRDLTAAALEKARITPLARRRFGELSGGQQQRVLFARAIVKRPTLLILDEPCTGLDFDTAENFYSLIHRVNSEDGVTVVMVSHDLPAAKKFASKVAFLNGELKFFGSFAEWEKYSLYGGCL